MVKPTWRLAKAPRLTKASEVDGSARNAARSARYSACVSVIGRVPQSGELPRHRGVGAQAGQEVVAQGAEDPGPRGGAQEDVGLPDAGDQRQAADQGQHDDVGERAVDDGQRLGGVGLTEQGVEHHPRAVAQEQRAVPAQEVVVAQLVEGVPALEVAVAEVDEVVADQAADHQKHPLAGPALAQHPGDVAQRPAARAGPHDGLDEGDHQEEDQGLGQPVAQHLALGVAHRDAEGGGPLGHHGRPEDDDDPEAPHVAVAAGCGLVWSGRRDVRQAGPPAGCRLGHGGSPGNARQNGPIVAGSLSGTSIVTSRSGSGHVRPRTPGLA